jgi:hypothetical protein
MGSRWAGRTQIADQAALADPRRAPEHHRRNLFGQFRVLPEAVQVMVDDGAGLGERGTIGRQGRVGGLSRGHVGLSSCQLGSVSVIKWRQGAVRWPPTRAG